MSVFNGTGQLLCVQCAVDSHGAHAVRRGLCNTCYMREYRQGGLWQYPSIAQKFGSDDTLIKKNEHLYDELEDVIKWVMEYDYDKLVFGLREYLDGTGDSGGYVIDVDLTHSGSSLIGAGGYKGFGFTYSSKVDENGKRVKQWDGCSQCPEERVHARGLCQSCYTGFIKNQAYKVFPDKGYLGNVEGTIFWLLNYFKRQVFDIAETYYGVKIVTGREISPA